MISQALHAAQQAQRLGLAGDPRQLHHPRHQRTGPTARHPTRRITAPANRIQLPQTLLDQEDGRTAEPAPNAAAGRVRQPDPEFNVTTFAPRRLGRDVNSRPNTATCARVAVNGSIPSRSQTSRYSAKPSIRIDGPRFPSDRSRSAATPVPARAEPAPATSSPTASAIPQTPSSPRSSWSVSLVSRAVLPADRHAV